MTTIPLIGPGGGNPYASATSQAPVRAPAADADAAVNKSRQPAANNDAVNAKTVTHEVADAAERTRGSMPTLPRAPKLAAAANAQGGNASSGTIDTRTRTPSAYLSSMAMAKTAEIGSARAPAEEPARVGNRDAKEAQRAREDEAAKEKEKTETKAAQAREDVTGQDESEEDSLGRVTEKMNQAVKVLGRDVGFRVSQQAGDLYVEVVDKNTDRVIRRLPPEDLMTRFSRIKSEFGMIVDKER